MGNSLYDWPEDVKDYSDEEFNWGLFWWLLFPIFTNILAVAVSLYYEVWINLLLLTPSTILLMVFPIAMVYDYGRKQGRKEL